MDYTKTLLIINSLLLAAISLLCFVAGYFLRDVHKDFKALIERVNKLYADLYNHINWFDNLSKLFQKQIDGLETKVKVLEEKLNANKN
jgi:predicted  nucleic acid-binding Zn-ribbon protein